MATLDTPKSIGTKHTASAKSDSRLNDFWIEAMKKPHPARYAICLKNKNCEDLVVRKIYPLIPDTKAEKANHTRVIDESGEDYLYPASYFFIVEVPHEIDRALRRTLPAAA
ncbi:MAG: hypothetical protein Tsb0026_01230 [Sulfuricaulis sp.]